MSEWSRAEPDDEEIVRRFFPPGVRGPASRALFDVTPNPGGRKIRKGRSIPTDEKGSTMRLRQIVVTLVGSLVLATAAFAAKPVPVAIPIEGMT
jgi:hypothetical protein